LLLTPPDRSEQCKLNIIEADVWPLMLQANERNRESIPPKKRFYIVGIGASAGGVEAFLELLRALPSDAGLAVVVPWAKPACLSKSLM